jgi:ubiquinol-cytochrome c reductase cytochrome c1 subunit
MVRLLASLVGAAFVLVLGIALFGSISGAVSDPAPATVEEHFYHHPIQAGFKSDGIFGTYDERQLQRGFQVYKEVCSACHSLRLLSFRDLAALGYEEGQVKAIAKDWAIEQPTLNAETGEPATRKNLPSDRFPSPFANETAARAANNNALPPDLSLMAKARHDGTDYIYSLVGHGYVAQPAALLKEFPDAKTPKGLYFNQYFPNLNIAMPPPLREAGQVQYADGTKPTVDQMAKDVSEFLTWAAEPNLEQRHAAGLAAMAFALIFCFLAWGAYQNVWRDIKH